MTEGKVEWKCILCLSPTNLKIVLFSSYIMTSLLEKFVIPKNGLLSLMPIMANYEITEGQTNLIGLYPH